MSAKPRPGSPASADPAPPRRRLASIAAGLRSRWWLFYDGLAAVLTLWLAHVLTPWYAVEPFAYDPWHALAIQAVAVPLAAYATGLHDWNALSRRSWILARSLAAMVAGTLVTLGCFYLFFYQPIGRWVLGYALGLGTLAIAAPRLALHAGLSRRPWRLLFVGATALQGRIDAGLTEDFPGVFESAGNWIPSGADGPDVPASESLG
jgi:hypothetical protein